MSSLFPSQVVSVASLPKKVFVSLRYLAAVFQTAFIPLFLHSVIYAAPDETALLIYIKWIVIVAVAYHIFIHNHILLATAAHSYVFLSGL